MARISGSKTKSASGRGNPRRRAGSGESVRVSSLSRADLHDATSWECFLHATFFMILSSDGPRIRPDLDVPPSVCEDDIVVAVVVVVKKKILDDDE